MNQQDGLPTDSGHRFDRIGNDERPDLPEECHIRRVKTARMLVLCVLDGYHHRGIGELLVLNTPEYGKHTIACTGAELGWTVEGNDAIDRVLQRVGAERYKTCRRLRKDD